MEDRVVKLARLIEDEKEMSWVINEEHKQFSKYQESLGRRWDDEASRSLWTRYITPHDSDSADMIETKGLIIESSEDLAGKYSSILESDHRVMLLSEEIKRLNQRADREITTSSGNHQRANDLHGQVIHDTQQRENERFQFESSKGEYQEKLRQRRRVKC